jgi:hypothetical protein
MCRVRFLPAWLVVIYAGADYQTGLRKFCLPLLFAFERGTVFFLAMVVSYNTLYAVNLGTSFVPCATANSWCRERTLPSDQGRTVRRHSEFATNDTPSAARWAEQPNRGYIISTTRAGHTEVAL